MAEVQRDELVSVVLPFRDRADVLGRAIRSVLTQTYEDIELILVDDQSGDASSRIAASFSDPRVRMVRTAAPAGAGGARNVGIDLALGRYLAFQDSDDEWLPNKLERQLEVLRDLAESEQIGAVGCRRTVMGNHKGEAWSGDVVVHSSSEVLGGCVPGSGTPALLIDRAASDANQRFEPDMPCYEERDFLYRALAGRSVAVIQVPLLRVQRGRSDHISGGRNAQVGLEFMIRRYHDELLWSPKLREWYHYAAMREALRCGDYHSARQHRARAGADQRLRIWVEYGLGRSLGESGLTVAARAGFRPDFTERCAR